MGCDVVEGDGEEIWLGPRVGTAMVAEGLGVGVGVGIEVGEAVGDVQRSCVLQV